MVRERERKVEVREVKRNGFVSYRKKKQQKMSNQPHIIKDVIICMMIEKHCVLDNSHYMENMEQDLGV